MKTARLFAAALLLALSTAACAGDVLGPERPDVGAPSQSVIGSGIG